MIQHISNKIQNAILKQLFSAQKSIKIAVAWFTNDLLFQPLLLKLQIGLNVEIILNDDEINHSEEEGLDFDQFVRLGGILRWNKSKQLMHQKFCIIDDNIVISGSYNWTNKAEYNDELVTIYIDEKSTVDFFNHEFATLQRKFMAEQRKVTNDNPVHKQNPQEIIDDDDVRYSHDGKILLKGVNIESCVIREGTETVDKGAFQDCRNLRKIQFPSTLKTIEAQAFKNCSLSELPLPSSISKINESAFENNPISTLIVPEGVIRIGGFSNCHQLKKIMLPQSLRCIEANAFTSCGIEEIYIPQKVEYIGERAFANCKKLSKVHIPESIKALGKETFKGCCSLLEISLPNSINNYEDGIKEAVFEDCTNLKTVFLPKDYDHNLPARFFKNCKSITEIVLPEEIHEIENEAFCGCSSLRKVVFPKRTYFIDHYVFMGCESLESVDLRQARGLGAYSFKDCTSLHSVACPLEIKDTSGNHRRGKIYATERSIDAPGLGDGVFVNCVNLESASLNPNYDTSVPAKMFDGCKSLKKVYLNEHIDGIRNAAFRGCTSLTEIDLPDKLRMIESEAFKDCISLNRIAKLKDKSASIITLDESKIPPGLPQWYEKFLEIERLSLGKGKALLRDLYLERAAFENCKSLEYLRCQDIDIFGSDVFKNCSNLFYVSISIKPIDGDRYDFAHMFENHKKLICCKIFFHCVEEYQEGKINFTSCFKNCQLLSRVLISYQFDRDFIISKEMFSSCENLSSIRITANWHLISVEEHAFFNCKSLSDVYFLTLDKQKIAANAFEGCSFQPDLSNDKFNLLHD
ncbi:MAG: leucine-rich repeat protein [Prevotella sp.]|nr:leucine-rich repeat protein [Prevotella sp.]